MNILFFIHNMTGGGAERVMSIVANAFAIEGESVTIAVTEYIPKCVYKLNPKINIIGLRENYPTPTNSIINKSIRHLLDLLMPVKMRILAKRVKADVVISFISGMNVEILQNFKRSHIPIIVCEHTNVTREIDKDVSRLRGKLYPSATAVTVLTKRDYELWKDKYPNVFYLPNPCTPLEVDKNQTRRKVVFTAGRVQQWDVKGYDNLIRAWAKICHNHVDWNLEIAGQNDDSSLQILNGIIEETKAINVHFLGFRNDVAQLMATSEIYCLSSRVEGLPMSLLEAMSAGCCCISFDCTTGPADIIEDGINGVLVNDQDVNELAIKLDALIQDDSMRRRLSSNSGISLERFSERNVMKKWYELIEKI